MRRRRYRTVRVPSNSSRRKACRRQTARRAEAVRAGRMAALRAAGVAAVLVYLTYRAILGGSAGLRSFSEFHAFQRMTQTIHVLPDHVANQIAAGEVIQRPASVVKELMENAVDAGATAIEVHVLDAGRTSIQVLDNGSGMSAEDARVCFQRHATSKLQTADDPFALATKGFVAKRWLPLPPSRTWK